MARESAQQKLERMTQWEKEYWAAGYQVAGIDEVGRGPLAGPVVTACIVVPPDKLVPGVDDSKKLSPKRREALYEQLLQAASYVKVARLEAGDIDPAEHLAGHPAVHGEVRSGRGGGHVFGGRGSRARPARTPEGHRSRRRRPAT